MVNGKVLSIFTKKTATGHNSRYIRGQFDLGGGVLKVADVNVRSIKLVEVATETPEEPAGSSGNEQVSPDPIVQEAQVCDSDDGSTSQVPTVDADSMPVTTETQDQMEVVGTPNAPEAREEQLPNDAIPTEAVETEPPPDEIAAARSPSESMDGEEGASSVPGTTTTTVTTRHSQRIENNERAGIVAAPASRPRPPSRPLPASRTRTRSSAPACSGPGPAPPAPLRSPRSLGRPPPAQG